MTDVRALLEQRRANLRKWATQSAEQGDYREAAAYQERASELTFLIKNTEPTTEGETA